MSDFNFMYFLKFLKTNNVFAAAIVAILSDRVLDVTGSFVDDIILPIINVDIDGDGKKDIRQFENKIIKFNGINFKIGKFILSILKFLIVSYILFIITKMIDRLKNN